MNLLEGSLFLLVVVAHTMHSTQDSLVRILVSELYNVQVNERLVLNAPLLEVSKILRKLFRIYFCLLAGFCYRYLLCSNHGVRPCE